MDKKKLKENIKFSIGGFFVICAIIFVLFVTKERIKNKDRNKISPELRDIEVKKIFFGTIEPYKEVILKPQISGILEKIYIKEGKKVSKNTIIARIKPLYSPLEIENAEKNLKIANILLQYSKKNYINNKILANADIIPKLEFEKIKSQLKQDEENVKNAERNLNLIKKGYFKGQEIETNIIKSTIEGTILELPLKEGSTVTERSFHNEGSTIAIIGVIDKLIFRSYLTEDEVASLKKGVELKIKANISEKKIYTAKIDKISAKGKIKDGIMKFMMEAKFLYNFENSSIIKPGFKAIAEALIDKKTNVLTVKQEFIEYENDKPFVYIFSNGKKKKCFVETGISDDIYVEIKSGLKITDKIYNNFK